MQDFPDFPDFSSEPSFSKGRRRAKTRIKPIPVFILLAALSVLAIWMFSSPSSPSLNLGNHRGIYHNLKGNVMFYDYEDYEVKNRFGEWIVGDPIPREEGTKNGFKLSHSFDFKGNYKLIDYKEGFDIVYSFIFEYDDYDRISKTRLVDKSNNTQSYTVYNYLSDDGNHFEMTSYGLDGSITSKDIIRLKKSDQLIIEKNMITEKPGSDFATQEITKSSFDDLGRPLTVTTIDKRSDTDEEGSSLIKIDYRGENIRVYSKQQDNDQSESLLKPVAPEYVPVIKEECLEFDDKGNCLKLLRFEYPSLDEPVYIRIAEYTYY